MGELVVALILDFFIEELAPEFYNKGWMMYIHI
ncbi:MAG: hypothetical protein ACOCRK_07560 [bacterium]